MRDYQQLKSKYILPKTVYNQTLWRIRDYYRLKEEANYLLESSSQSIDDMPKSKSVGNPVENIVIKRENYLKEIEVIEKELNKIPEEYQRGVWNNIMFGENYPCDASRATYSRYKSKFIHGIAKEQKLI